MPNVPLKFDKPNMSDQWKRFSMSSFRSYVNLNPPSDDDNNFKPHYSDECDELKANLLPGETVVAEAKGVLLFTPLNHKQGKAGLLTVTNFKLSFVTTQEKSLEESCYQENLLLGDYDVCLSNVDSVYLSTHKKRRLLPGNAVPDKVKSLLVLCKNMRVMTFDFKFCELGQGRKVTASLLHYAFPLQHHLLFAYAYKKRPSDNTKSLIKTFRSADDWSEELSKTGCKGWRVTTILNKKYHVSSSLPESFVVPNSVTDSHLKKACEHFKCNRPPIWCWGNKKGAALVRMADITPAVANRSQEAAILQYIRNAHPDNTVPVVCDLTKEAPSMKELESSYIKLRDICTPDSINQFWSQDSHFFTSLENSKWLIYVSICLSKASEAAKSLYKGCSVVLQEGDDRDINCVISSLTILLVDHRFRTLKGFQTLIHKEWVILGHPFCTRLGFITKLEDDHQRSPVFLLFLDCVWQLLQQKPNSFEFTETYLTSLWDAAQINIFDTFLFDCDRDRFFALNDYNNRLPSRDVWNWHEILSEKDIKLFYNPFFIQSVNKLNPPLTIFTNNSDLLLWSQCYFRFLPILEIADGGKPKIDLLTRTLLSDKHDDGDEEDFYKAIIFSDDVSSFFPFTHWKNSKSKALLETSNYSLNDSDVVETQSIASFSDV